MDGYLGRNTFIKMNRDAIYNKMINFKKVFKQLKETIETKERLSFK